ncbi:MAG: hypothetical protein BGO99_03400 [Nitrosospira sp. 56-18]|nr:MAG: hypothetical protein BGO99_03400 [Nitrosospira sp. 56-18]
MNLVWNWKDVLKEAWSVRLGAGSALLALIQQSLALLPAGLFGLSPEVWSAVGAVIGALSVLFAALVAPARLIDQGLAK